MREIIIPMVPSKNILGLSRWWRNSHNDRVVWRQRVSDALQGVDSEPTYTARVVCDWGARAMPANSERLRNAITSELWEAIRENGVVISFSGVDVLQSGRGRGETRLLLEVA